VLLTSTITEHGVSIAARTVTLVKTELYVKFAQTPIQFSELESADVSVIKLSLIQDALIVVTLALNALHAVAPLYVLLALLIIILVAIVHAQARLTTAEVLVLIVELIARHVLLPDAQHVLVVLSPK
jgi:hypothetical protein